MPGSKPVSVLDNISRVRSIRIPRISTDDCFINDDHSETYERREFETIISQLGPEGVILGTTATANDVLAISRFKQKAGIVVS
jgi:hypothetical protein